MPTKKTRTNLFSGGILASASPDQQEQGNTTQEKEERSFHSPESDGEDDPLFGHAKRMQDITQKAASITDADRYPKIAIEKLENNPHQPRRRMNQKRLNDLAREIKNHGFKGALVARVHPSDNQRYQLVFGHRRREASKLAGLLELPVIIDNTVTDAEMKFLALNENLLRDDLTPLDEAYAYTAMLEDMSQEAVAERLGVSRGYLRNRIDILKAPEDVQDMVEEKPDTMKAVVYLKDVQEDDIRKTAIQALKNEEITINQMKAFIENLRKQKSQVTVSFAQEERPVLSSEQNGHHPEILHPQQEHTPQEKHIPEETHLGSTEIQSSATVIYQSKQQTESITDRTKIEAFTRYLEEKYSDHLTKRSMTSEEREALDTLITVIGAVLRNHPTA